jgi:hypothetical protein
MTGRWPAWIVAPLLAAPLVALTAWIAHGLVAPAPAREGSRAPAAAAAPAATPAWGSLPPDADLPADRLEERVDGGAEALRADGCRRLLHWRFEAPPADAEALVFGSADGAKAVLAREAGSQRTPGPGDEAQLSPQSAYFRRGAVYVRIFLDPGAPESPELGKRAEEIDRVLAAGGSL